MAEASGETKPVPKQENAVQLLNLTVKDQWASVVQFRVKSHTKFEKIFKAYCHKKGLTDFKVHRFLYDGNRLQPEQTPAEYDMEDGDLIECMIEQQGGCSCQQLQCH